MSGSTLRRSGRRRNAFYKKGDFVEVLRDDGIITVKLLRKTADSSPSNPRWVVALKDGRRKNEEVPEKSLGKIVDNGVAPTKRRGRVAKPKRNNGSIKTADSEVPATPSSSSSSDGSNNAANGTPRHNPSLESTRAAAASRKKRTAAVEEGDSNTKQSKSVSFQDHSRQARKKLRMARINTRASARNDPHGEALVAPMDVKPARRGGRKGGARPKAKKNEEVVKVKMLTGTLYLYKGETRRAEFVRIY